MKASSQHYAIITQGFVKLRSLTPAFLFLVPCYTNTLEKVHKNKTNTEELAHSEILITILLSPFPIFLSNLFWYLHSTTTNSLQKPILLPPNSSIITLDL